MRKELSGLPDNEVSERINFYSEMIDDRMEDGLSEEYAVAAIGSVDEIARQITADIPSEDTEGNERATDVSKESQEKTVRRKINTPIIILLALGSPLWLSLLIAVASVIFSVYSALWAAVISLWAAFGAVASSSLAGLAAGAVSAFTGNLLPGIALIGASLFCGGLGILLFFGCNEISKGTLFLTKLIPVGIKKLFAKRRKHNEQSI